MSSGAACAASAVRARQRLDAVAIAPFQGQGLEQARRFVGVADVGEQFDEIELGGFMTRIDRDRLAQLRDGLRGISFIAMGEGEQTQRFGG